MFAELRDDISAAGGAAGRAHLVALGHSDRQLAAAVEAGAVIRARRGWYSVWTDDDPRLRALRVGGRLTALSAIAAWGGWVRRRGPLRVAVPVNAARLRCPRSRTVAFADSPQRLRARIHWVRASHDRDTTDGCVPLLDALELACLIEPPEDAIAAIDWARRSGRLDALSLAALRDCLPVSRRWIVAASSELCDSLPESLARTRIAGAGLRVREQVRLPTHSSPIDLLVEGTLALDVDGDQYHRERFDFDRGKDLAATRSGFHALRPSARHVFDEWQVVLDAIRMALRARGVATPEIREHPASASRVNNSGQPRRTRRRTRPQPRSTTPRPRQTPPFVLNC